MEITIRHEAEDGSVVEEPYMPTNFAYELRPNGVALVTLNTPKTLNSSKSK